MEASGRVQKDWWGKVGPVVLGLGFVAALSAVDLVLGTGIGIEGTFVVGPLITALFGYPLGTAFVALASVLAAVLIGSPQASDDLLGIKTSVVGLSGILAIFLAKRREDANERTKRVELLDRISRISDDSPPLEVALEQTLDLLDEVSEAAAIYVADEDGLRLLTKRGESPLPEGAETLELPLSARDRFLGVLVISGGKIEGDPSFALSLAQRTARTLDNAGLFDDYDSLSRRLDTVVSLLDEAVFILSATGSLLYVNDAGRRFLDVPEEEPPTLHRGLRQRGDAVEVQLEDGTRVGSLSGAARYAATRAIEWDGTLRLFNTNTSEERFATGKLRSIRSEGKSLWSVATLQDVTPLKRQELHEGILADLVSVADQDATIEQVLQGFADTVVPGFADCCWVYMPRGGGLLDAVGLSHLEPDRLEAARELNRRFPVSVDQQLHLVESQGEGTSAVFEISDDLLASAARDDEELDLMRRIGNRSGLTVPMRNGDELLGVLAFGNGPHGRTFTSSDRALAEEIGSRCGQLIFREMLSRENAEVTRLFEAGVAQRPLPEIPGFEIAETFRTSTNLHDLGGDFYEVFENERFWNLMIGDVVGRGARAAMLTIEARAVLRTALGLTEDPSFAFAQLDQHLRDRALGEQATVAVIRVEKEAPEQIFVSSAGHPLPLLERSGAVEEVGETGPILGVGLSGWPVTEVQWRKGSSLVLYTDGLSEARRDGTQFGAQRIEREIRNDLSPTDICRGIDDSLDDFLDNGSVLSDDIAVLVLRRIGEEAQCLR